MSRGLFMLGRAGFAARLRLRAARRFRRGMIVALVKNKYRGSKA